MSWNAVDNTYFGSQTVTALLPFDEDGPGPQPEKLWIGHNWGLSTWDGTTAQTPFSLPGAGIDVLTLFDAGAGAGPELYAGGRIFPPDHADHVRRWDGSTLSPVGNGLGPNGNEVPVRAMAVFDEDGSGPQLPALFVGGSIRLAFQATGQGADVLVKNNMARWDGSA